MDAPDILRRHALAAVRAFTAMAALTYASGAAVAGPPRAAVGPAQGCDGAGCRGGYGSCQGGCRPGPYGSECRPERECRCPLCLWRHHLSCKRDDRDDDDEDDRRRCLPRPAPRGLVVGSVPALLLAQPAVAVNPAPVVARISVAAPAEPKCAAAPACGDDRAEVVKAVLEILAAREAAASGRSHGPAPSSRPAARTAPPVASGIENGAAAVENSEVRAALAEAAAMIRAQDEELRRLRRELNALQRETGRGSD